MIWFWEDDPDWDTTIEQRPNGKVTRRSRSTGTAFDSEILLLRGHLVEVLHYPEDLEYANWVYGRRLQDMILDITGKYQKTDWFQRS